MLYTYDFKKVLALVGGVPMQGFADGTGIEVELDDDLWVIVTGADGETARARRHGLVATMKLTFMQTSPSNDVLSGLVLVDILENAGVVPVLVKDVLGSSVFFSARGFVKKPAGSSFGKEVGNREWSLVLPGIDQFVGGNAKVLG